MGLRSANFFFNFFDLYTWEKIKNSPLFITYKVTIDGIFENFEGLRKRVTENQSNKQINLLYKSLYREYD
jgi:hypothetical protein